MTKGKRPIAIHPDPGKMFSVLIISQERKLFMMHGFLQVYLDLIYFGTILKYELNFLEEYIYLVETLP